MLIAYEVFNKIKIATCENDESKDPACAIEGVASAERILAYARLRRADIIWSIERHNDGKFGVCGH